MTLLHRSNGDRTVHAFAADGAEIVRYDRSGKWYIEWSDRRVHVRIDKAVSEALKGARSGKRVVLGRSGGTAFDARVRAAIDAAKAGA